ncbi:MAG TPA: Crp/Fnr family transcriptional regulator [Candidatus Cybelea sp.]|nr:Crp/Fnr family transcriptional regulator [Candidatus Cybelea sp.]
MLATADVGFRIGDFSLLESLNDADKRAIEQRCHKRTYSKNETILDKGSQSREVFFVLKGSVSVITFSPAGREVTLATVKAGDFFGELAAIDSQPRSASVTAIEKSEIAIMPPDVFLDLMRAHAEAAFYLMMRLARMIRASGVRILELSTLQAAQRVYAELLRMAQPDAAVPGLWVVRPLPPMHEIASMTSTTRETVNRAISQLYPGGILKRKGRNLYIMERSKLEEIVQSLQAHHLHR